MAHYYLENNDGEPCACSECQQPPHIRRLLGRIYGMPRCCVDGFEDEDISQSGKNDYLCVIRGDLCEIMSDSPESIRSYVPCPSCSIKIWKRCESGEDIRTVCEDFIIRRWPLEENLHPMDAEFRQHASDILSPEEYDSFFNHYFGADTPEYKKRMANKKRRKRKKKKKKTIVEEEKLITSPSGAFSFRHVKC